MKQIIIALFFLSFSIASFAQNYYTEFAEHFQAGDTEAQLELLKKWEKEDPKNAELFTCYFNYYFFKAREEVLALTTEAPDGEVLELTDQDGESAGFMGSQIIYHDEDLKRSFDKIDKGIKNFPDRLDMRLGKIYALGQIEDWTKFTETILTVVDRSIKNENKWFWTKNEKREDGENFLLTALQDYQLQLYNTNDDALLDNMAQIANKILTHYPDHVESLSNLSITYLLTEKYDEAIKVLKKAEALHPEDTVVLGNIAECYSRQGKNKQALSYYQKVIQFGDAETQEYAKQRIANLKQ